MAYLDYNATTPLKPAVHDSMVAALGQTGNPSSVHNFGRQARALVESAREEVAALVGVKPAQVIFTAGGTEANNQAMMANGHRHILVSASEHDSVRYAVPTTQHIGIESSGQISLASLREKLTSLNDALVSVMLVNNETGVIQPLSEVAALTKSNGALLHCDAVQAVGRIPLDFKSLGVDMMTLSAHKIGGPQGAGALIVRENLPIAALLQGGGQEMRRRAGTENVAAIVGFGEAARLTANDVINQVQLAAWRDQMEQSLLRFALDARVMGAQAPRVGNTSCIVMPGVASETQVMAFDLAGVAVSAGAACSSGKVKASHVLRAMGCGDEVAGCAIRVSSGWNTTKQDIEKFLTAWQALYQRKHSNFRQAA